MPEKRRFFDVWIVETNTVYKEVPFQVVADWVQQGRLLEDDRLRPSGTSEWFRLGATPEFSPYLPRPEPFRAEDQAEALEPVELDFRYKHRSHDDDDDVDMIPLIDVSLVLLVVFMLTATGVGAAFIPTSPAEHGDVAQDPELVILGINLEGTGADRHPVFMLAPGGASPAEQDNNLRSMDELLARLQAYLTEHPQPVNVSINAHPDVKAGIVRDLTAELERRHPNMKDPDLFRRQIRKKFIGVSGKQS
jgi:biopolymer transport protein ExbD